jgi:hypothetical protein
MDRDMDTGFDEPAAKRRKIRKGTRSCWECKGRKVRCTYTSSEDTVCDGCFRRGTDCVSQELPEQPLAQVDKKRRMTNRMFRVEALIERLVKKADTSDHSSGDASLYVEDTTPAYSSKTPAVHQNEVLCSRLVKLDFLLTTYRMTTCQVTTQRLIDLTNIPL